jgi:hypothetical protein
MATLQPNPGRASVAVRYKGMAPQPRATAAGASTPGPYGPAPPGVLATMMPQSSSVLALNTCTAGRPGGVAPVGQGLNAVNGCYKQKKDRNRISMEHGHVHDVSRRMRGCSRTSARPGGWSVTRRTSNRNIARPGLHEIEIIDSPSTTTPRTIMVGRRKI